MAAQNSIDALSLEYKRAYARECGPRIKFSFEHAGGIAALAEYERAYQNELSIIAEADEILYLEMIDAHLARFEQLGGDGA